MGYWLGWIAANTFSASRGLLSHVWRQRSGALDFVFKELALLTFSSVQFICEEPELRLKGKKDEVQAREWDVGKRNSVFLGLHRPEEKLLMISNRLYSDQKISWSSHPFSGFSGNETEK